MAEKISIEVINWEKYNPRRDLKRPSWYRQDVEMPTSCSLFGLKKAEKYDWIALLCRCTKNHGVISGDIEWLSHLFGSKSSEFSKLLKEFEKRGLISMKVGPCESDQNRTDDERLRALRDETERDERDETERDETERDENLSSTSSRPEPKPKSIKYEKFAELWNEHSGTLKKVRACTLGKTRKSKIKLRLKEEPDFSYWETVAKKLAASSWASGKAWASFDWIIANDVNHVKAFEGNYDDREPAYQEPEYELITSDSLRDQ